MTTMPAPGFRPATRADVGAVVALLADDVLGQGRETVDLAPYLAAFDAMQAEGANQLILGVIGTGFFLLPTAQGQGAGGPPQFQLAHLIMGQSPQALAPALGTTPEALVAGLAAQGITVTDPARPLAEAAAGRNDAAMAAALLASRQP